MARRLTLNEKITFKGLIQKRAGIIIGAELCELDTEMLICFWRQLYSRPITEWYKL